MCVCQMNNIYLYTLCNDIVIVINFYTWLSLLWREVVLPVTPVAVRRLRSQVGDKKLEDTETKGVSQ